MDPNIHYLLKLPLARALFSSRIPAFLEFMNNLKLGPSATTGKIYERQTRFGQTDFILDDSNQRSAGKFPTIHPDRVGT